MECIGKWVDISEGKGKEKVNHNISGGFLISMPDSWLPDSIILPYCPSEDDSHINDYFQEELVASCMSRPFSSVEMHALCDGHFMACPVHVVTTTDEFGKIKCCIVCNISFCGAAGFSMNNLIDSDDFPTEWA